MLQGVLAMSILAAALPVTATAADAAPQTSNASGALQVNEAMAKRTAACTACHGMEGRATAEGYFPRIAGKPAGYLYNQLINFREGRRQYPLMIYIVDHLSDVYLMEMAQYFSSLHPPYPPPQSLNVAPAVLERGRVLAMKGDPSRNVPACIACHGPKLTGIEPTIPGVLGLPHDYLNAQFGAWRNGTRQAAAPDCMATITARLTPADINAVSSWLASQPVPEDMKPLPELPAKLPMECGSVPLPGDKQ
jgi:cytochrome c553